MRKTWSRIQGLEAENIVIAVIAKRTMMYAHKGVPDGTMAMLNKLYVDVSNFALACVLVCAEALTQARDTGR